jgi:hypothetical protein
LLRTTTHAPFAAEVEPIVSNLVAFVERFGSQDALGYPMAFDAAYRSMLAIYDAK